MRIKVELTQWNGIVVDDDPGPPEADYDLVDADTGKMLSTYGQLKTYEDVEAYIARHYPDCERWLPPPAPPEESTALSRILELLDAGTELDRVVVRRFLIGQLYQSGYPDETVTKIKSTLERLSRG